MSAFLEGAALFDKGPADNARGIGECYMDNIPRLD
jgi:hypothetical protein